MVDQRTRALNKTFRLLENDIQKHEKAICDIQQVVENVDNNARKNNLRIKGLKEGAVGDCVQTILFGGTFYRVFGI